MQRRRLPAEQIVAAHRAGNSLPTIASRLGCSQSGIRRVLAQAGVTMRPRGGARNPVSSPEIVRLRGKERLSWEDITTRTGLSEESARTRYRKHNGRLPNPEWHQTSRQRPDLDPTGLKARNTAVDLKAHIAAAYRERRSTAAQLGREFGISG